MLCLLRGVGRFLPPFCPEVVPVLLEEDQGQGVGPARTKSKRLGLACWQMAWDRFTLAAAMVDMLPFFTASHYKQASCVHEG